MKKIVICGGHLTPALALIETLQKEKNIEIVFFGRKFATEGTRELSQEYKIITKKRIKFYTLKTGRLQRKMTKYTLPSLLKLPIGITQAFYYLIKEKPDLVVSFGSYLSTPVVVSAFCLGIKSITHEQAIIPGLATQINSHFALKIFLTWPQSVSYLKDKNIQVIGNLISDSVLSKKAASKKINGFLDRSQKLLFISGGNQGSHFINNLILNSLNSLKNYSILHQVGSTNFANDLDRTKKINNPFYLPVEFLTGEDFSAAFNKTDILIGRSGVNTLWNCLIYAKPAIFIPLAREQRENALFAQKLGFAKIIDQSSANPKILKNTVEKVISNYSSFKNAAKAAGNKLPKNAAYLLAKEIKTILA